MTRHWTSTASELVCIALVACIAYGTVLSYELIRTTETVRQKRWREAVERVDWRAVDVAEVMGREP